MSTLARKPFSHPVVERALDLRALLRRKSYFLFGPRQAGKTFLIRRSLSQARFYDLLDSATYVALSRNPGRLAQELSRRDRIVVIDEVQRLPELLNEAHRLIEERGVRFLLTGSSARKLRQGGITLLGGRVRVKRLHPLTSRELGQRFRLERAIARGLLPSIYCGRASIPEGLWAVGCRLSATVRERDRGGRLRLADNPQPTTHNPAVE